MKQPVVYRCFALSFLTVPLLACAQPESDNPFGSDGGASLTASSSNDGTTAATSDGSTSDEGDEGPAESIRGSESGAQSGGSDTGGSAEGATENADTDSGTSTTGDPSAQPFPLDEVIWLNPNISEWPETITQSSITRPAGLPDAPRP